eukprot:369105-Rhodomonas_salina.1
MRAVPVRGRRLGAGARALVGGRQLGDELHVVGLAAPQQRKPRALRRQHPRAQPPRLHLRPQLRAPPQAAPCRRKPLARLPDPREPDAERERGGWVGGTGGVERGADVRGRVAGPAGRGADAGEAAAPAGGA